MGIKSKYEVRPIQKEETYPWLLKKHYAKRIPSISYAFGLYDNERILHGICTFGKPASNPLCNGIAGKENTHLVYELNRLCIDDKTKNIGSFFVSACLKNLPKPLILVSYADTSHFHHGYIYQATNWIYTGLSVKFMERFDPNNPNRHNRHCTKDMPMRERPRKHRYIYFTGSKKEKKGMIESLNYKILPYPKGDNNRYDASFQPDVQGLLF